MVCAGWRKEAVIGNLPAVAELNAWVDPEAAAIVLASGARITTRGWDISRKHATFGPEEAGALRALGPPGTFAIDIPAMLAAFSMAGNSMAGSDLPAPIAMVVALDPAVATRFLNFVVETASAQTTGRTLVDHLGIAKRPPNVQVVQEASYERCLRMLGGVLRAPWLPRVRFAQ